MLIEDLIEKISPIGAKETSVIQTECSAFIRESGCLPLYKLLPTDYNNFHKVKVRQQKKRDQITEAFDKAFGSKYYNFRQRAVFTYPEKPIPRKGYEPFYIFPINGFKYLYSKEVTNSSDNYQQVINTLFEQLEDNNKAIEIVTDILKYTYCRNNLIEGIISNSEIIFYGIPYFYAVRSSLFPVYKKIITP